MVVVRPAIAIALASLVAGCSGTRDNTQGQATLVCQPLVGSYAACSRAPWEGTPYTIFDLSRRVPVKIAGAPTGGRLPGMPAPDGWWRVLLLSPDGRTLLGQWSGECESQSTYLISTHGGKPRMVFHSESRARGWSKDGRARVFLAQHGYGPEAAYRQGLYLVDPKTMKRTLVRPVTARQGC
jgi:hypothetical protein